MQKNSIIELMAKSLLETYKDNAEKFFSVAVETNPEAFPLLSDDIEIYSVIFSKEYFHYTRDLIFVKRKNGYKKYSEVDISNEKYYKNYNPMNSDDDNKITVFTEFLCVEHNDVLLIDRVDDMILQYVENDIYQLEKYTDGYYKSLTKRMLQKSAASLQKHLSQPMNYYAKNAAKFAYSLLDLKPMLDKVNDEDFSYQLDQAIAAYDNSLYLASCATLGVCLETLCRLLLIKEGEKIKDSDATMLDRLSERLKAAGIINYKFKNRIDVCYKVRNMASHTSPGKVVQNDCHFILNTMHEIVDIYF